MNSQNATNPSSLAILMLLVRAGRRQGEGDGSDEPVQELMAHTTP
jgi:hypothetical protein